MISTEKEKFVVDFYVVCKMSCCEVHSHSKDVEKHVMYMQKLLFIILLSKPIACLMFPLPLLKLMFA